MFTFAFGLLAAFALGTPPQGNAPTDDAFPPSSALAEGVSPETLGRLSQLVQTFVDEEEVVGAELLVLKNGRSILHEAYGWRNREDRLPMATGGVFCVRSMTKPLIGAAILMLVDDDRLELDDPAARYLPSFDVAGSRDITIEHLLTHTSGLPMSLILGQDLNALDGIRAVAELGAGYELGFEPGSAFHYSDQGTDTLTALIEVVTDAPAADFVRARVLEPLAMRASTCVMGAEHSLRARASCKYVGSRGAWTRFWSPADPPLFPFFLGSQGLYSTLTDYARFLDFWLQKGRAGKERLLASRLVRKALTPGPYPLGGPTGFAGLRTDYGYLMQLWTGPGEARTGGEHGAEPEREVVAFGHTGSDGTYAWVFPDQEAMVLYFTQSRNGTSGLRVEELLGELFLGAPYDPNQAAPPFEQYLGYYWEGEGDIYRAIVRDGEDLALEILGKAVVPLTYVGEDHWKFRPDPRVVLAFDRSPEGEVTGYHIGDHQEFRFEPNSPELPSADELAQLVQQTHRMDLVESIGPLRIHASLAMEKLGMTGETTTLLAWPDRFRLDSLTGDDFEHYTFDGSEVRCASSTRPATTLTGEHAEAVRLDSPFVRMGDWRDGYPALQVIQRIERRREGSPEPEQIFLVRTGDASAPARTLYVHSSGRLVREDSVIPIEGMGRIGQRLSFGDYREVAGVQLPYRTEIELANPLVGTIVTTITDVEIGVALPANAFELAD